MRCSGRITAALAATLLLLGLAAVTLASDAQAVPAVQISGSAAPAAVHGDRTAG